MDIGELIGLLGMLAVVGVGVCALGGAYALGRLRGMKEVSAGRLADPAAESRLARIEALLEGRRSLPSEAAPTAPALEAIALEVERIGESQRFLMQVFSERRAQLDAAPGRPSGTSTPH